jgi:hypothetical protein
MNASRNVLVTRLLACSAVAVASVGCGASGRTTRAAVQSVRVDLTARQSRTRCTIEGAPRVLAAEVAARAGINAQANGARVLLRFSKPNNALAVTLTVEPQSLDAVDVTESALWQTPAAEVLGAEHPARGEFGELSEPGPTRVDSERWVSVWNAGSIYTGMDVRVRTADRHGTPIGAPITLASDGRAFGAPAVAIGSSGRGVIALLQSGERGFALVAASLDCHVPPVPDLAAGWAMHRRRPGERPSLRTAHSYDDRNDSSESMR